MNGERKHGYGIRLKYLRSEAPRLLMCGDVPRVSQTMRFEGTVPGTVLTSDTTARLGK